MKFLKKAYALVIPVIVTVISYFIGLINASRVDDIFMMKIAESFKTNEHSEQLMFISELYGYLLKFLYKLIPSVSWYWALLIFVITISFMAIHKIVADKYFNIIFVTILIALQAYFLAFLNFTTIAFLCVGSGILWYISYVDKISKSNIKHIIISALLIILGFCMRYDSVYYCMFLLFIPVYFFLIKNKKISVPAVALLLIICTCANYSLVGVHKLYDSEIPSETYYNQFQEYRSDASDGGLFEYTEDLMNYDISQNDYELYEAFVYGDKEVYDNESVKAISVSRSLENKYTLNVKDLISDLLSQSKYFYIFIFVYLALALIAFIFNKNRRWEILLFTVFLFGAVGFLFFRRRAVLNIVLAIVGVGIFYLLYVLSGSEERLINKVKINKRVLSLILSIICITAVAGEAAFVMRTNEIHKNSDDITVVNDYIASTKSDNEIYITDPMCINQHEVHAKSENLLSTDIRQLDIYSTIGDWYIYTYYWYDQMEQLGLEQYEDCAMKALLDDRVKFVSKDITPEMITTYFDENYGINVDYKVVENFPEKDITIYDFDEVD